MVGSVVNHYRRWVDATCAQCAGAYLRRLDARSRRFCSEKCRGAWQHEHHVPVPLRERFERNIKKDAATGCWLWTASVSRGGYAYMQSESREKRVPAHRISYELHRGAIPEGLQIDHLCRVRRCVNPDHLEPVTAAENTRRGRAGEINHLRNLAKTTCRHGHLLTPENTYVRPSGFRECRECVRIRTNAGPRRLLTDKCSKGHMFTTENTYITARGGKRCRACHRENERVRKGGL